MEQVTLLHGDALEVLRTLPDNSVDAIVTDPPAGIGFMGKQWDTDHGGRDNWIAAFAEIARECLRVVKPGAHALVWAIPRTSHWTATAWENGGWEVRDRVAHVFGSGFPKSHDVSKAIDKAAGAEREVVGEKVTGRANAPRSEGRNHVGWAGGQMVVPVTAPATAAAKRWQGWGSALKPAMEDWWLLRKPLTGTIAANVLEWGTGGLNIDATRVQTQDDLSGGTYGGVFSASRNPDGSLCKAIGSGNKGRWPAHLIHDGSDEVVAMFPDRKTTWVSPSHANNRSGDFLKELQHPGQQGFNDTGSAARFFYVAKASKRDRDEGLEETEGRMMGMSGGAQSQGEGYDKGQGIGLNRVTLRRNHHPTVKPTELMRYLCRLITPAGGVVLDPFAGSGSTGKGAVLEGFSFIGVEKESDYLEIARARIAWAQRQQPALIGDE